MTSLLLREHSSALWLFLLITPVVRHGVSRLLEDFGSASDRLGLLLVSLVSQTPCDEAARKAIEKLRRVTDERVWFGCSPFMAMIICLGVTNFLAAAWRHPTPIDGLLIVVLCFYLMLIYSLLFMLQAAAYGVKLPGTAQAVPPELVPGLRELFSQADLTIATPPPRPVR